MLLIVDIGNSIASFALSDHSQIHNYFTIPTSLLHMQNQALLLELLQSDITTAPHAIIIASVVPSVNSCLQQVLLQLYPLQSITFLNYQHLQSLMPLQLPQPETVGIDRLIDAYAAIQQFGHSLLVIDMGTATTFNLVDPAGCFIGGAITIGFHKMQTALTESAEGLATELLEQGNIYPQHFGNNSKDSVNYGLFWGYRALVVGLIQRLTTELSFTPQIILTGGVAHLFYPTLQSEVDHWQEHLTLEGIQAIAKTLSIS